MDRAVIHWDDDYIFEHWESHRNWLSLCNSYNSVHNASIRYNTFKSHCYRLGLNFHYSTEQEEWLKEFYPSHGYVVTAKKFNERYKTNRTTLAIKQKCKSMRLAVDLQRRQIKAIENTGRYHETGSIVPMSHGELYLKTEHGFKRLKEVVYGKVPKGKIIVHLNGDKSDCSRENLLSIKRSISGRMTINNFWSDNGIITKTGIMCCELEELIE